MSKNDSITPDTDSIPIQNVIVVLLENRSYDNILGALYSSNNQSPYNSPPAGQAGLDGLDGAQPNPSTSDGNFTVANQTTPTQVDGAGPYFPATAIPVIDPGEPFNDMAQQITGSTSIPSSNPYVIWPPTEKEKQQALMKGFVYNYESKAKCENLQDIMNYLTPAQLPVSAFLANNFAVCDTWFASLPTQTFTNRVFACCGAPAVAGSGDDYFSLVDDLQYITDAKKLVTMPSVFQALDTTPPLQKDNDANWKLYFHDYSISIMTTPYVKNIADCDSNINISTYDSSDWDGSIPHQLKTNILPTTFVEDISNGTLPPYSFIEPRYTSNYHDGHVDPSPASNCNHPGTSHYLGRKVHWDEPAIDTSSGELFLMQLYNTLRNSNYWKQSLLIITYDEHGGVYDHVAPPAATDPGKINWIDVNNPPFTNLPAAKDLGDRTSDGFNFNAYGGRVPAIVVSPFVQPGSTLKSNNNYPFDHSSLVRTVLDVFNQSDTSLSERDAAAPSVIASSNMASSNNNTTKTFEGTILCAPSSLNFHLDIANSSTQQILQASAGNVALSASSETDWLSLEQATSSSLAGSLLTVTVTANKHGVKDGTHIGSIKISGDCVESFSVPVAAHVTLF